ncbi:MAG: ABC transporter substrate-binding protein [Chloroflexi bacterium]|nr:ABC transporter substrate-binding protein [Chloroflexota bacterium]
MFDTLDPHQTQFGPLYSAQSSVFSKVLKYVSHIAQISEPDLAEAMPEVVDKLTYIITIRKDVFFHDTPEVRRRLMAVAARERRPEVNDVAGRQLTAEDVKFSFERQMNPESPRRPLYYRASQYASIDKIELIDKFTLKVTTKEPTAPFVHYLADTNAFIIAKELVDPEHDTMDTQDKMVGTGPFIWGELKALQEFTAIRNPNWFGWGRKDLGRPYSDGLKSLFIVLAEQAEPLFCRKEIDGFSPLDAPALPKTLKDEMPELQFIQLGSSGWLNSRFKLADEAGNACTPYNDYRVRRAVHLATDRQEVIDTVFRGSGLMQPPVGFVMALWALPQQELTTLPGYRQGPERDGDLREARRLYEAAGSPPLAITFADLPASIAAFAPQLLAALRRVLGGDVEQKPSTAVSYPRIAEGWLRGCDEMTFTWGFDNGWIDLDDWVYPYFHSRRVQEQLSGERQGVRRSP